MSEPLLAAAVAQLVGWSLAAVSSRNPLVYDDFHRNRSSCKG